MSLKSQPLVSIVTVVYNGAKTIEQTINSVKNQTYKHIEYIVIDGKSTDGTLDILEKHSNTISILISEEDNGLYDAMNKGIKLAKGELIGMINSDDWYEFNAVETIVNAYLENPNKRIFHGDRFDIENGVQTKIKRFDPSTFKFKYFGMTYNHPSMFVHKEVYSQEVYSTSLNVLSDYQFVLKQYLEDPEKFHYIPFPYVNYRLDGISGNMSIKTALKEGFNSRKKGGLSFIQNCIALGIRFAFLILNKIL